MAEQKMRKTDYHGELQKRKTKFLERSQLCLCLHSRFQVCVKEEGCVRPSAVYIKLADILNMIK